MTSTQWHHITFLLVVSAGAFQPTTKSELQAAVDLYTSNQTQSDATYGAISTWDTSLITDMSALFYFKRTFNGDISSWDTSSVTNMSSMFADAERFDQNIGGWDTSRVTDMSRMFSDTHRFNQYIGGWDTSKVTSMSFMFYATAFNQSIGGWDTSSVTTMSHMFAAASYFNQHIGGWNTSSVTTMSGMFNSAYFFNQSIGGWVTNQVTDMSRMFATAVSFNQNIAGWDTSSVTNMERMFADASWFTQPLDSWDTSSVTNMERMFADASRFTQPLDSWDVTSVTSCVAMLSRSSVPCAPSALTGCGDPGKDICSTSTSTTSTASTSTGTTQILTTSSTSSTSRTDTTTITTATASTTWSTFTTSAASLQSGASCTTSRMTCPAPNHNTALGTYAILGKQWDDEKCKLQGTGGEFFFDFAIDDCNVSRDFNYTAGLVTDVATLVYVRTAAYGTIITDLTDAPPAEVVCTCRSPIRATVSGNFSAENVLPGNNVAVDGEGELQVSAAVYPTEGFQTPIGSGGTVPAGASRLYLDVRSASAEDLIGLQSCTVAPTDDRISDFAVEFLGPSCADGPLDVEIQPENMQHVSQVSIKNFKFAGTLDIFLWCSVLRCQSPPCGKCDITRRLRSGRRLFPDANNSEETLSIGSFKAAVSALDVVVLPGGVGWSEQVVTSWQAPVQNLLAGESPQYVKTNLTLYGSVSLTEQHLDAVASVVSATMAELLSCDVQVLRILAVPRTPAPGRLLSSGGLGSQLHAEVLVVESGVAWSELDKVLQLRAHLDSPDFKTTLTAALSSDVGIWSVSLQAAFGPLALPEASAPAKNEELGVASGTTDLAVFVTVALLSLLLGFACACAVARNWRRCLNAGKASEAKLGIKTPTPTKSIAGVDSAGEAPVEKPTNVKVQTEVPEPEGQDYPISVNDDTFEL